MHARRALTVSLFGLALWTPAFAGHIDFDLQNEILKAGPDTVISTLVYLKDQVDTRSMTAALDQQRPRPSLAERHRIVVEALQAQSRASDTGLFANLDGLARQGRITVGPRFWIVNAVQVDATPREILALAERSDIDEIFLNYPIELIAPVEESPADDGGPRTPEPGLVAIHAPDAWAAGYDGTGVLVSHLDTGVGITHVALQSRWRGDDPAYAGHPEWAWFYPLTGHPTPYDSGTHGTHTMGTICGGAPGDQIGVAPGAQWISAGVIDLPGASIADTVARAILAFQWIADPDGNPNTNWDVPAVCSNSWGVTTSHGYAPCAQTFWAYIDNCEAAGVTVVFAAGNEGPSATTIRRPADRADSETSTFSVGNINAADPNYPISSSSSRGPVTCGTGNLSIKPEVCAPGTNVRSALPTGTYGTKSGTSMATPHVAGAIALMRQACPDLTPEQLKQILIDTAVDLGTAGNDNSYGYGIIDAYAAVQMALDMCGPHPPRVNDLVAQTPTQTSVNILLASNDDGLPDPPAHVGYRIVQLPANGTLIDPAGGVINHVPYDLGTDIVRYRPSMVFAGIDTFGFVADDGGVPPEGGPSAMAMVTVTVGGPEEVVLYPLDVNPGWTMQGQWEYGVPTGSGGASHGNEDPTAGFTGANVFGVNLNGDYGLAVGGPYYLTAGPIDLSNASVTTLRYQRWLNSDYQPYVTVNVDVSANGTDWTTVWQNSNAQIADSAWVAQEFDISDVADHQATVYVRWGYKVNQTSAWAYSGWNVDDVAFWGLVPPAPPLCAGDLTCDGFVNFADINPLIDALSYPGGNGWPHDCPWINGDCNSDGAVNFKDINAFVSKLGTECQ